MTMEKANTWSMSYFVSFSLDSFIIEVIVKFFKLFSYKIDKNQINSFRLNLSIIIIKIL